MADDSSPAPELLPAANTTSRITFAVCFVIGTLLILGGFAHWFRFTTSGVSSFLLGFAGVVGGSFVVAAMAQRVILARYGIKIGPVELVELAELSQEVARDIARLATRVDDVEKKIDRLETHQEAQTSINESNQAILANLRGAMDG
ncbi:MAG: hypothetical protein M1296_07875 [Chloroflexi bacterium]|nr:hypothetical protein [Chloroflexota bacterium]